MDQDDLCLTSQYRLPTSPDHVLPEVVLDQEPIVKALLALQEVAANKFIQERFVPKLTAAGITVVVDIVRKPDENAHPATAIVKKADEVDAACIVVVPHEHEFVEVCPVPPQW